MDMVFAFCCTKSSLEKQELQVCMSEMLNTLTNGFLQAPLGFCPQIVFVFHIITRSSDCVCKQH